MRGTSICARLRQQIGIAALACGAVLVAGAAEAQEKVNMAHAGATVFRLPIYVAMQNGYFKEQGIDLTIVETRSGSDGMKMLAGGSVHIGVGQLIDALNLNNQGIHVQGIAMLTNRLTNSIVVRKDLAGSVKKLADLNKQPLGVTGIGSGTWQFAVFNALQEGLKRDDLNFIGVGTGASVIGAVKSKRVAALSYAEPETLQLVKDGDAEFLIDMADPATHARLIGPDYLNNWIMALGDYAKKNPAVLQRVVNAIQQGIVWLQGHSPEETTRLLMAQPYFAKVDASILTGSVSRTGIPRSTVVTRSAFDNGLKPPRAVGVLKSEPEFGHIVNNTFAEAAAKTYPAKP